MKNSINSIDAALLLGMLFGVIHLSWLILVYLKYAQVFLDFIYWVHFIKPIFEVQSFDMGRALILLALTVSVGAVLGYVLSKLFNTLVENNAD
jgi:thiamine transporter ThiT